MQIPNRSNVPSLNYSLEVKALGKHRRQPNAGPQEPLAHQRQVLVVIPSHPFLRWLQSHASLQHVTRRFGSEKAFPGGPILDGAPSDALTGVRRIGSGLPFPGYYLTSPALTRTGY